MNKEIRKRKRTFLAVCLALVVVLLQLTPVNVLAATYQLSGYNSDQIEPDTDIVRHHIEDELPDFYRIRK